MSTEAALAARHRATEAAIRRVHDAITRLRREKAQVSFAGVARRAGVSRTFLYSNPDARTAVATALAEAGERRVQMAAAQDDEREATWRERALNAEDAIKAAHAEILAQRTRIGELLGQVRCCGFPKFPTVDHWNSPGDERCGGPGMSLRGCQVRSSQPVSSAMVTGSSQCGQQPPVPARRMKVPHWSQRWFGVFSSPWVLEAGWRCDGRKRCKAFGAGVARLEAGYRCVPRLAL